MSRPHRISCVCTADAGGFSISFPAGFVCMRPKLFRQPNGNAMNWAYIVGILGIAIILYLIGSLRVLLCLISRSDRAG
jgi:hypothetical protein